MNTKRTLDDLFASAARESSPVSDTDVHAIITTAGTTAERPIAMASIIAASALAAGIIGYMTMSNSGADITTVPFSTEQRVTTQGQDTAPSSTAAVVVAAEDGRGATTLNVDGLGISVIALDAENLASLDLDPLLAERLQRIIASVDSMRYCNGVEKSTTVCAWNNGAMQEIKIHDGDGPQPVMFTTHDGKGQMILPEGMTSVDVNALVPVETKTEKGSMLMWFPPTQTLLEKLPDDIASALTITHESTPDLGNVVRLQTLGADGAETTIKLNIDSIVTSAIEWIDIRRVMPTIDSVVQSAMAQVKVDAQDVQVHSDGAVADADGVVKRMNIDSILRSLDISSNDSGVTVKTFTFTDSLRFKLPDGVKPRSSKKRVFMGSSIFVLKSSASLGKSTAAPGGLQEVRSQQGALNIKSIYPNPTADGGATLSYDLREERILSVDLVDLTGTRVAGLLVDARKRPGQGQLAFAFGDVPPGMYLLRVTTDKGETAVQRIVIQK